MEFKILNRKQEKLFRQWAREHYKPGSVVDASWHPCVRDECHKMNYEGAVKKMREVHGGESEDLRQPLRDRKE